MSLGLGSAKLGVGFPASQERVSRQHLVSTSIAEKAVFIPKPYKRVSFQLVTPGPAPLGAGKKGYEPISLPGSGKAVKAEITGGNIARGSLGANGVTARFDQAAWKGAPGGYVEMKIDLTPAKQNDVIAIQEEGRQINHKEIHFTQQYDSYGRPRIGFSREPYDFAAAKYVSVTSQIAFERNMEKTHEAFEKYNLYGEKAGKGERPALKLFGEDKPDKVEPQLLGADKEDSKEIPIFGQTSSPENDRETSKVSENFFLGIRRNGEEDSEKRDEDRVTAEESYKTQKVEIVDVFEISKKPGSTPASEKDNDSRQSIDVTV